VAVPPCRPCRAKAVSWARPAAHDLHNPSCRHGHVAGRAVPPMGRAKRPCRGPCRRPMGRLYTYTCTCCCPAPGRSSPLPAPAAARHLLSPPPCGCARRCPWNAQPAGCRRLQDLPPRARLCAARSQPRCCAGVPAGACGGDDRLLVGAHRLNSANDIQVNFLASLACHDMTCLAH
jgi:hypothetical protein